MGEAVLQRDELGGGGEGHCLLDDVFRQPPPGERGQGILFVGGLAGDELAYEVEDGWGRDTAEEGALPACLRGAPGLGW